MAATLTGPTPRTIASVFRFPFPAPPSKTRARARQCLDSQRDAEKPSPPAAMVRVANLFQFVVTTTYRLADNMRRQNLGPHTVHVTRGMFDRFNVSPADWNGVIAAHCVRFNRDSSNQMYLSCNLYRAGPETLQWVPKTTTNV
jgi:hypothetical protein